MTSPLANPEENSGKYQGDIVLDDFIIDGMLQEYAQGRNASKWNSEGGGCSEERGLGTDVAVVSSCVFVAQLLVSVLMGLAVKASGSTAAVVAVAAALAAAAAVSATKITYLDL
ncbi:hypothetical protein MSG28_002741 [Choristoneura fumiferana]|uniref:Uncharacterized protein n=1 Tax=Choristoneura fumiferana TaxID=7141 RepID=A0ACC0JIZ5_CHOFU|nr:hypothetical protein MSG28_002741 [Choristoneura fumiferana]